MTEIKVVNGIIKGLTGSPILLVLVLLNLIMVGGVGYFMLKFGEVNAARFSLILERCLPPK